MSTIISSASHVPVYAGNNLIIEDNKILLQEKTSGILIYVAVTEEILKMFNIVCEKEVESNNAFGAESDYGSGAEPENLSNLDSEPSSLNDVKKIWTRERTIFLIETVKLYSSKMDTEVKKQVWEKISKTCTEEFKMKITLQQVESKWKSLKRTYKSILVHNNTSGKQRRYWEYFNIINEFMHKRPEIVPVATCSSHNSLVVKSDKTKESETSQEVSVLDNKGDPKENNPETSFSKKRRLRESEVAKRHKEKLARMDRFNDLFEKMIEKM